MIKQRAVIYARVSTERQKEKQTIDSQLSILPEIIKQRGFIHILEPYVDDGISGETIEERPAMTKLLSYSSIKHSSIKKDSVFKGTSANSYTSKFS